METTGGQVKKGAGGRQTGRSKKKAVSRFIKAGLQFLVARIARYLEKGRYAQCISTGVPIYLAAEVFELARNAAHDNKKSRIIPWHMLLAISLGGHCPWKGSSKHYPDAVALEVAIQFRQVSKECLESLF